MQVKQLIFKGWLAGTTLLTRLHTLTPWAALFEGEGAEPLQPTACPLKLAPTSFGGAGGGRGAPAARLPFKCEQNCSHWRGKELAEVGLPAHLTPWIGSGGQLEWLHLWVGAGRAVPASQPPYKCEWVFFWKKQTSNVGSRSKYFRSNYNYFGGSSLLDLQHILQECLCKCSLLASCEIQPHYSTETITQVFQNILVLLDWIRLHKKLEFYLG